MFAEHLYLPPDTLCRQQCSHHVCCAPIFTQGYSSCADKYARPSTEELDSLGEDDIVRIVYVNKEEAWVYIEWVDESDKVYGKL